MRAVYLSALLLLSGCGYASREEVIQALRERDEAINVIAEAVQILQKEAIERKPVDEVQRKDS